MAYVRKVRTASGAVAVQVARKDHGRVVILAHLGSAHTDAELGILLERPSRWSSAARPLSISRWPPVPSRSPMCADFREQRVGRRAPAKPRCGPVVAPGRTLGTSSRLLYDVLGHVYDWLGFDGSAMRCSGIW